MTKTHWIAASSLALLVMTDAARAEPIEDFYKGKAVNMIIGLGEGGGYDFSARLVARRNHNRRLRQGR